MVTGKERYIYEHAKLYGEKVLDVKNDINGNIYTLGKGHKL